jgi:hypothetical protein
LFDLGISLYSVIELERCHPTIITPVAINSSSDPKTVKVQKSPAAKL